MAIGGTFTLADAAINITGKVAPGLNKALGDAESAVKKNMGNILALTSKVGAGMTAAGAGVLGFFGLAAKAAGDAEKNQTQLTQVLKSTGGAAGMTAAELGKMAAELGRMTPFEDDAIIKSEALLLTFTKVGRDVFPQAQLAILNMSQALGNDLKSSTIMVGKALNDPIKGMTALTRAGVSFTQQQKDQVKAMVAAGDVLGAQKLMLKELETEFGGQALAAGKTFNGQMVILKNTMGNLMESIGARVIPTFVRLAERITPIIESVMKWVDENPKLTDTLVMVGGALGALGITLGPLLMALPGLLSLFSAIGSVLGAVGMTGGLTAGVAGLTVTFTALGAALVGGLAAGGIIAGVAALGETFYKLAIGANDCSNFISRFFNKLLSFIPGLTKIKDLMFDFALSILKIPGNVWNWIFGGGNVAALGARSQQALASGQLPSFSGAAMQPAMMSIPRASSFPRAAQSSASPGVGSVTVNINQAGEITPAKAKQIGRMVFAELRNRR